MKRKAKPKDGADISERQRLVTEKPVKIRKSPDIDKLQCRVLDSKTVIYFRPNQNADEKLEHFKENQGKIISSSFGF